MRDHDEYDAESDSGPYVVIEQRDSGIGMLLLGIAVGAGAALLFAPQSGVDTRRLIRHRARTASDVARRKADEMVSSVTSAMGDVRDRVTEQVEAAKSAVLQQRDEVVDAFNAGRSAAHEARIELERKIAEKKQARQEGTVL